MFAVADQDAALAFYTEKLGWEVRGDTRYGENGEMQWLEVAPPGSRARVALSTRPWVRSPVAALSGSGRRTSRVNMPASLRSAGSTSTRNPCALPVLRSCSDCVTRTATGSTLWRTLGSAEARELPPQTRRRR
jgi:hypothetical protein